MSDSPVAPSTGRHPRLSSLRSTTEQGSPVSTRQRQLGQIGGKSGPGYSPYARRVATRSQAQPQHHQHDEEDREGEGEVSPTHQPRQAQGLFGRVRSLPGRMLGLLTRSSSSKQLAASTSLADVRAELDGERQREARQRQQGRAEGITRSKTSYNVAQAKVASQQPQVAGGLSSSSSMSALSTLGGGPAGAGGRSAHSTLVLPHSASTNGSGAGPSFLTAANLGRHSRAASPALSSTSLAQQRRSPSPLRNGLVGSMSSFQLAHPPSPTSASAIFNPTLGNGVTSSPFGLTSRSPFVSRTAMQPRSPSVSGRSVSSVAGGAAPPSTGHPLFPYTSTLPRGTSPSLTSSVSMRDGLSSATRGVGQKRPFRAGSPLNPQHHFLSGSATVGSGLSSLAHGGDDIEMLSDETGMNGVERARKKQLVWDPQRGLVSRERLEKEKEREAPPMPKNEAERILEVLEGMGRTPLGEAKRGTVKPKHINVPALEQSSSRLPRSSTTPSILSGTPYAARASRTPAEPTPSTTQGGRPAKGLQAVLRAREDRRRALIEQEREERERERVEDEERERERERRRRERRRRMDELVMSDEMEDVFSASEEEEVASPKRVTRSAATRSAVKQKAMSASKGGKGKERLLEPPTPSRRSTRASSRAQTKSPSPVPAPRRTRGGKAAPVEEEQRIEEMGEEAEKEEPRSAKRSTRSRSPAPRPSTKKQSGAPTSAAKSPSPPPTQPTTEAAPAVPKITFPTPSSFPATAPSTSTGRSSLRPGKSHTSRQHASSSRVFSAKEEDLPRIDDEALAKIQMPAFKIPAGFSFGASAAASTEKQDEVAPAALSSSLLSRLGAPASTPTSEPAKSAFSFGTASAPADKSAASLPTFSFGAPAAKKDAEEKETDKLASIPAASDFFAKPATSAASSSGFSFSTAPSAPAPATNGKPSFFASILADKEKESPTEGKADEATHKPIMPSFSFGAVTKKDESLPVIKPTEVVPPTSATSFAAYGMLATDEGKTKEVEEAEQKKDEVVKPTFSFVAPAAAEKKEEQKKDAPATLFSFGAPKTDGAAAPSPFSFGAGASKPPASHFTLGASSTPAPTTETKTPAPAFTFGTTPATPQADEKKDSTPTPAPLFGGLSPAKVAVTDDADGDSGMEDEGGESSAATSPAPPAAPAFSFGASSSSAPSPFGASTASTGFTFGASTDKKDAPPASPFGAPAASPSLFGGAASTAAKPSFTFGASPSASPAPPSPAATAPSFTFGASTSAAGAAPSPFAFGAQSSAPAFGTAPASSTAAPFAFGSATPSPAPGTPTGAPASTGFTFGAPSSIGMGQSLSTSSATAAPSFSFGAPASQHATPGGAPASPFTFGAPAGGTTTGAVASPSGAVPFTFGASTGTPGATGGFTFGAGAPASAPGTPGATGGGLFNIGSGGNESSTTGPGGRPWRQFSFFGSTPFPSSSTNSTAPELVQHPSLISYVHSNPLLGDGIVLLADLEGSVHWVDEDWTAERSWRAYDGGRVQLMETCEWDPDRGWSILVTVGDDSSTPFPLLKVWLLTLPTASLPTEASTSEPPTSHLTLLRQTSISPNASRPSPVSSLAVSPSLSHIVVGLADGSVVGWKRVDELVDSSLYDLEEAAARAAEPASSTSKGRSGARASSFVVGGMGKLRTFSEGNKEPVTNVGITAASPSSPVQTLFILTTSQILALPLPTSSKQKVSTTLTVLDDHGAAVGCAKVMRLGVGKSVGQEEDETAERMVVAREEAIYVYGSEGREGCWAYEGPKSSICPLHASSSSYVSAATTPLLPTPYLAIVSPPLTSSLSSNSATIRQRSRISASSRPTSTPGASVDERVAKVTIFDPENKFVAFSGTFGDADADAELSGVRDVVEAWGAIWILTEAGKLFRLTEQPLQDSMATLFQRNLYTLAISLAKSRGMSESEVAEIYRRYGDHLYSKSDYEGAMSCYLKTVGTVQASYVIRKFLDAQRLTHLTSYLQELHSRGLANSDITTLLLNCYTKLADDDALSRFIHSSSSSRAVDRANGDAVPDEPPFDLETAIRVLRQASYFTHASWLAERYRAHGEYLRISIEDTNDFVGALRYVRELARGQVGGKEGREEAEESMKRWGGVLLTNEPDLTTDVLVEICCGEEQKDNGTMAKEGKSGERDASRDSTKRDRVSTLRTEPGQRTTKSGTASPGYDVPDSASPVNLSISSDFVTAEPESDLPSPRQFFAHFADHPRHFVSFLEKFVARRYGKSSDSLIPPANLTGTDFPLPEPRELTPPPNYLDAAARDEQVVWNTLLELYVTPLSSGSSDADDREGEVEQAELRAKAMKLLRCKDQVPYDKTQALLVCTTKGFEDGFVLLYELLGMYEDVVRYWIDASLASSSDTSLSSRVVRSLRRYGPSCHSLYRLVLRYLTTSSELLSRHQADILDILDEIDREKVMPPIAVVQILSSNGTASIGLVREYLKRQLLAEKQEIESDQALIASYRTESAKKRKEIQELSDPIVPRVFQVTRCSACGGQLDLPATHFMCRHSYHQRCLGENETQCPNCARTHGVIREIRKNNEQLAGRHDLFVQEVSDSEDPFATVANAFARGWMSTTSGEDVAA
ncbi:vacuolar membrane protein [Rhodotorula toruloides]|uniref:Vacuolar membrane protein n=1 Tax=Rhodotorula toruloides TaxID=5286 RepID=A0A511KNS4_RHOTO|nr:vacuolar membrane protein [Rhodotorula toruloides]